MRAVYRNLHVAMGSGFVGASEALNREFARQTEAVFARIAAGMPRARRKLVVTMIVEVISAMLFVVTRRDAATSRALLDETKVMLRRYVEPYVSKQPREAQRTSSSSAATRTAPSSRLSSRARWK